MLAFVAAAAIGIGVGVISGMLGIGGGSVMVPVFRLGFGLSALQATATSLFAIIPTSLAGVVEHLRNKTCIVPIGLATGAAGALLSPAGVYLASRSPGWAIMLATGAAIIYSSGTMLRKAFKTPADVPSAPPVVERSHIVKAIVIGLLTGVMAGYIGLGGGFFMIPLFVSVLGFSMKQASGTSLLAISILATSGVASHLMMGNVEVLAGLAMALGTVPGAIWGARLSKRVPERSLRFAFGIFLIVLTVFLIVNEFALHL